MVDSPGQTATSPLLQTKLYIPKSRPGLVPRPRLTERLNKGTRGKLTLVSAPAGFGKTTLLAEWLVTAETGTGLAAWVALDQNDNEPSLFWAYVIAALQSVHAEVGTRTLSLLESPQPLPVETLLGTLVNEISASSRRFVLVLDDYHLIDAQPVHQGIAFLLDHLPPQLHLVIAGRTDPPLPLSRLRGRGELAEVRAADLRFTADEAAAFLNETMGLDLSAQHVAALDARTEGWIEILRLIAAGMRNQEIADQLVISLSTVKRHIANTYGKLGVDHRTEAVARLTT